MPLNDTQSKQLFYLFLVAAALVNLIFAIALAKHYVFASPVDGIGVINTIFAAEIMGIFFMLIKAHFLPTKEPGISVVTPEKYGPRSLDSNDVDEVAKRRGIEYLNQGRASGATPATRHKALREAKRIFESIPRASQTYPSAQFNLIATNRELKDFSAARRNLEDLRNNFNLYFSASPDDEKRSRRADLMFSEALILEQEGDDAKAKSLYEDSWRADPADFTAPYNLAVLCNRLNLKEEFLIWHEVLKRYPEFPGQIEPQLVKDLKGVA